MQIRSGLFDHIVLQRDSEDQSQAPIAGTVATSGEGTVLARLSRNGRALPGWRGRTIGRYARGRFRASLTGVRVGGPYDVELRLSGAEEEALAVVDVLVGDVWLLAGQSNMHGVGRLAERQRPDPMVRACYMHDAWAVAEDPIHNHWSTPDPAHGGPKDDPRPSGYAVGVGPGVSFGVDMHEHTGVPQGLIACAKGGTKMTQWDPKGKRHGGRTLYGAMIRRLRKAGGQVAGLVWYQGESDATAEDAPEYTRRMKAFVRAVRRDTGRPDLPIACVQIGRVVAWPDRRAWNAVQDQQRRLNEQIDGLAFVPAIDLELDDAIHIRGRDQGRLGRRLAAAMRTLRGQGEAPPPIALGDVTVHTDPASGFASVSVACNHVEGNLTSPGRAGGMTLHDGDEPSATVYRIDLEGNRAILRTRSDAFEVETMNVHYGWGTDPYCNITDAAGRSLPVMGPVPVGRPRALTPFVTRLSMGGFLPATGGVEGLKVGDLAAADLAERTFPGPFCDLHEAIASREPRQEVVPFGLTVRCPKKMRLRLWLGYDGPVKVWINGRARHTDPAGTNPAGPQDAAIDFSAKAGDHEVLVALGTAGGNAWGVFLRVERLGVDRTLANRGPHAVALPELLPLQP